MDIVPVTTDVPQRHIESLIFSIRGKQVLLDTDLAMLYGVETKYLNSQVKRNSERFPDDFMFQLTQEEIGNLKSQIGTSSWGGKRKPPYVFTENGIAMLGGVLRSQTAIAVNIKIMRAFTSMRHLFSQDLMMYKRIEAIEYHQQEADKRIDEVFERLDGKDAAIRQGIFFDGQVFDAYVFVSRLVKKADTRIVLIDNYVDETVLTILNKRKSGVKATYTPQR